MPSNVSQRRFPPPWIVEEHNAACFIVRDATTQPLGYFYFEEEPGRRAAAKPAYEGRSAAIGCKLRQVAGAAAQVMNAPHL